MACRVLQGMCRACRDPTDMLSGATASCPIIDDEPSLYSHDRTCIMLSPSAGSSLPRCRAVRNMHLQTLVGICARVKVYRQLTMHMPGLNQLQSIIFTLPMQAGLLRTL